MCCNGCLRSPLIYCLCRLLEPTEEEGISEPSEGEEISDFSDEEEEEIDTSEAEAQGFEVCLLPNHGAAC